MESELAGENPVTIKINHFSPKELEYFLTILKHTGNMPNMIFKLLDSSEQCAYGENKHYTPAQYEIAKVAVKEYHEATSLFKETSGSSVAEVPSHHKFHK